LVAAEVYISLVKDISNPSQHLNFSLPGVASDFQVPRNFVQTPITSKNTHSGLQSLPGLYNQEYYGKAHCTLRRSLEELRRISTM
jgi:hypothetical protein